MRGAPPENVRILLVDDERNVLTSLARILRTRGFVVTTASSGHEALGYFPVPGAGSPEPRPFDVVVVDLKMPDMDGQQVLEAITSRCPRMPVAVLTGYGTVRSAVEAMRSGAFEYLVKPSSPEEIIAMLERAARSARAGDAVKPGGPSGALGGLRPPKVVGHSQALRTLMSFIERVAALPSTVLIEGESGTGKELMARTIHTLSPRSRGSFVAVNCAAVTPGLAEALFFGHRKGTFTGAEADRRGYFQAAHGGTLFLDEISDLPEAVQGVLLRVLQEASILPVGATRPQSVDVRVISATNRDLEAEVRAGRFRQDLFYRLNVLLLHVPPLRERPEDLLPLTQGFLEEYRTWFGFGPIRVSEAVLRGFVAHSWPGNVRELRNVIERSFAVCDGEAIEVRHLPAYLQGEPRAVSALPPLEAIERRQIQAALAATNGEKKAAAELLGIDRKRLYRKLRRLGLYG